jgi:hypothetical protein
VGRPQQRRYWVVSGHLIESRTCTKTSRVPVLSRCGRLASVLGCLRKRKHVPFFLYELPLPQPPTATQAAPARARPPAGTQARILTLLGRPPSAFTACRGRTLSPYPAAAAALHSGTRPPEGQLGQPRAYPCISASCNFRSPVPLPKGLSHT